MKERELLNKIEELKELESMARELNAEIESIKDSIKAEMGDIEELIVGAHIIRWTSVLSNRFDTTSFKKLHNDLYKMYTEQIASRRFTIS